MKIFETIKQIFVAIKDVVVMIVNLAIPVAVGMIALDIIAGTKFGVLQRATDLVLKLGIPQNTLSILVVVIAVIGIISWYEKIKK